jgi:hypothetical protein
MATPSVPPPLEPPSSQAPRRSALPWAFALAMVVVMAAAAVAIVWISRGDGETAADESISPAPSSSKPAPTTSSLAAGSTSTFSADSPTSSSTLASTSTTSTLATSLPRGACPGPGAGPLPAAAVVAAEARGDFDGDGHTDRFLVYRDAPFTSWPRVELSYGYPAVAPESDCHEIAGVLSVDLGGPAQLGVLETVDSTGLHQVTFYALNGCSLDAARREEGDVARFLLRDGPLTKNGITCREDGIDVTRASSTDGVTWQASTDTLNWDPAAGRFRLDPVVGFVLTLHSPEDDALIRSYAAWSC